MSSSSKVTENEKKTVGTLEAEDNFILGTQMDHIRKLHDAECHQTGGTVWKMNAQNINEVHVIIHYRNRLDFENHKLHLIMDNTKDSGDAFEDAKRFVFLVGKVRGPNDVLNENLFPGQRKAIKETTVRMKELKMDDMKLDKTDEVDDETGKEKEEGEEKDKKSDVGIDEEEGNKEGGDVGNDSSSKKEWKKVPTKSEKKGQSKRYDAVNSVFDDE